MKSSHYAAPMLDSIISSYELSSIFKLLLLGWQFNAYFMIYFDVVCVCKVIICKVTGNCSYHINIVERYV